MKTHKTLLFSLIVVAGLLLVSGVVLAKSENANQNGNGNGNQNAVSTSNADNKGRENSELHRSVVSTFVHNLLDVANREGGIGEQVRLIAREQNQSATTTIQAMERVQTRNRIKTFLIGSDYRNLGAMRSEMSKTQNRLEKLNQLLADAKTDADKTELQNQIQALETERVRIENFVKTQEGKFSLFGWLVKLFSK